MNEVFRPAHYVLIECGTHPSAASERVGAAPAVEDFRLNRVSGVYAGPQGIGEGTFADPWKTAVPVGDFADYLGEWCAVAEKQVGDQKEFLVFGDALGFCPVFLAEVDGHGVIVSDSFSGAVQGMKDLGVTPTLDLAHYIASIDARHPHFDNPSVRRTMAREIRIMSMREALHISAAGIRRVDRRTLGISASIDCYDDLVSRGVEFATSLISALPEVGELQRTINLSGGVDSRLALAMISAAGEVKSFRVNTVDPRTWRNVNTREVVEKDIAIANRIRGDRGMDWVIPQDRELLQFDFRDSLAFHQAFKSNFAFKFAPGFGHTIGTRPTLTIRGGGGEMLRSTATSYKVADQIRGAERQSDAALSSQERIANWYLKRFTSDVASRGFVEDYVRATLGELGGDTLEEVMNEQYLHNRNRIHFGHLRQSATTSNTSVHLLANPYFLRAREYLDFEERSTGKLVQDLFRAADLTLLRYPFESAESTRELTVEPAERVVESEASWVSSYDLAKSHQHTAAVAAGWSARERGLKIPYDRAGTSMSYLRSALRLVEDFVDPAEQREVRRIHTRLLNAAVTKSSLRNTLVAKVASAVEVRDPAGVRGSALTLRTSPVLGNTLPGLRRPVPVQRQVTRNGWNDSEVISVSPEFSLEDGRFRATLTVAGNPSSGTEFAMYLYRDSKRVDKSWYGDSLDRTFSAAPEPGSYHVKVFVRRGFGGSGDYALDTSVIDVEDPSAEQTDD